MSNSVVGDTLPVPLRAYPWGFVGVACQGQSLRQPSAATVSLRLGHTRAQHYPRAASLPLHKGGMSSGHPLIRCVTVVFADIICLQGSICLICFANQTRYVASRQSDMQRQSLCSIYLLCNGTANSICCLRQRDTEPHGS